MYWSTLDFSRYPSLRTFCRSEFLRRSSVPQSEIDALIDPQASGYAGEVSPEGAYRALQSHADAVLVDVRTEPEWQFTGVPDLRGVPSRLLLASWKTYPAFTLNGGFVSSLTVEIPHKDTPIFFICRTGGRSLDAAIAMTEAGYTRCFNVTGGFEGDIDADGRRCRKNGWKAAGLPWTQT